MAKQTAVEWLIEKWSIQGTLHSSDIFQAKEMEAKQKQLDLTNITRLEVINHAMNGHPIGRVLTMYETKDFRNIDMQFQDSGKTLKIFVS